MNLQLLMHSSECIINEIFYKSTIIRKVSVLTNKPRNEFKSLFKIGGRRKIVELRLTDSSI